MIIGILGGGQLARMLALAGTPLGLRFRCLDPSPDAVAGHVAELVVGAYDDVAALEQLARGTDVVTFEFENVPARAAEWLQHHAQVAPAPSALAIGQDRLLEKRLFQSLGMGVPRFEPADTLDELRDAVNRVGVPCVVKTRRLGYDGKGQCRIHPGPDVDLAVRAAHAELTAGGSYRDGLIVEAFVPFQRELSVLAVRGRDGSFASWPLVENEHRGGILHRSRAPAPHLDPQVEQQAVAFARRLLDHLGYVGVLAVELFEVDGRLVANEMAPRVHNSGHWTIEGSTCSQFENHLRAVCGMPLGSTAMVAGHCATMVNLVGSMPERHSLMGIEGVHVHAYGKSARAGRKLGHATVVAPSRNEADAAAELVAALSPGGDASWL